MKNIIKKAIAAGLLLAITGSFAACSQAKATTVNAGTIGSNTQNEEHN